MKNEDKLVQEIFSLANITLNGKKPWDIIVHDDQFYHRLLTNAELSIGETYVEGLWNCSMLDEFFYRVLSADLERKALAHPKFWRSAIRQYLYHLSDAIFNHQTKLKSFIVGKHHYDIGIDLYAAMLDQRMIYSCAYWNGATSLDDAQELKLKMICQKLGLKAGMSVLDIGCGWGGFARYASEHYGVSVAGITISQQQYEYAIKLCSDLPVEIRFQDYRDLVQKNEKYDRIVSVGMFEHVGYKNYATYMKTAAHCMKENGLFLLHTIGANSENNISSSWLNKYIFPNSHIPTIAKISSSFENIFVMEDWHNIGVHYDQTLMAWHDNFNQNWEKLSQKYDERFRRMWNYYLLSCAGSFRARHNQVWQILLSKKGIMHGYSR